MGLVGSPGLKSGIHKSGSPHRLANCPGIDCCRDPVCGILLEPWLEIESEVGLQYDIPNAADVKFLAALPLINSETGEYRGSRLSLTEEERVLWKPAIDFGLQFAEQNQELGYFGPLGIDACQYRSGGELIIRPMMDINARWTMGRIAWEWRQRSTQQVDELWLLSEFC